MNYPFFIEIDDYANLLTRLGVTIPYEIEIWFNRFRHNLIPQCRVLRFQTIEHAMQFSQSIVNDNITDLISSYNERVIRSADDSTLFNKIVFSLSLYFHHNQFSQWNVLKRWLLRTNEPISLELVYIRELMFKENENALSYIIKKSV